MVSVYSLSLHPYLMVRNLSHMAPLLHPHCHFHILGLPFLLLRFCRSIPPDLATARPALTSPSPPSCHHAARLQHLHCIPLPGLSGNLDTCRAPTQCGPSFSFWFIYWHSSPCTEFQLTLASPPPPKCHSFFYVRVFTYSKELTVYCLVVCSLCLAFSPSSAPHPVLSVCWTTSNSTSPCPTGPLFCTPLPHSHVQEHLGNISSICIFQVPFPLWILFLRLICSVGSWRHFISPL